MCATSHILLTFALGAASAMAGGNLRGAGQTADEPTTRAGKLSDIVARVNSIAGATLADRRLQLSSLQVPPPSTGVAIQCVQRKHERAQCIWPYEPGHRLYNEEYFVVEDAERECGERCAERFWCKNFQYNRADTACRVVGADENSGYYHGDYSFRPELCRSVADDNWDTYWLDRSCLPRAYPAIKPGYQLFGRFECGAMGRTDVEVVFDSWPSARYKFVPEDLACSGEVRVNVVWDPQGNAQHPRRRAMSIIASEVISDPCDISAASGIGDMRGHWDLERQIFAGAAHGTTVFGLSFGACVGSPLTLAKAPSCSTLAAPRGGAAGWNPSAFAAQVDVNTLPELRDECPPLNEDPSHVGRCGPQFGRCNPKQSFALLSGGLCAAGFLEARAPVSALQACSDHCEAHGQCRFFSYDPTSRACALYDASGRCPDVDTSPDYQAYFIADLSWAVYCHEDYTWCGGTSDHQHSQASDMYDFRPEVSCTTRPAADLDGGAVKCAQRCFESDVCTSWQLSADGQRCRISHEPVSGPWEANPNDDEWRLFYFDRSCLPEEPLFCPNGLVMEPAAAAWHCPANYYKLWVGWPWQTVDGGRSPLNSQAECEEWCLVELECQSSAWVQSPTGGRNRCLLYRDDCSAPGGTYTREIDNWWLALTSGTWIHAAKKCGPPTPAPTASPTPAPAASPTPAPMPASTAATPASTLAPTTPTPAPTTQTPAPTAEPTPADYADASSDYADVAPTPAPTAAPALAPSTAPTPAPASAPVAPAHPR